MTTTLERDPIEVAGHGAIFEHMATLLRTFVRWLSDHQDRVQLSYLIPERGGWGWYVIGKQTAFDFDLNKEVTEFGFSLIRRGYAIHATLLPGSVAATVPTDGIAVSPTGVTTYAG